jgi:(R,R)-butanediol dehydrogenase/meso-butanediol dehydrogenase/diacetyl reductase
VKALVVGGSPIGPLIAAAARREGADLVLIEPDPYRRSLAGQLGFTACDPADPGTTAILQERSGAAGAAVAFEVSGAVAGVATAVDALITRTEPLARAEQAFLALESGAGVMKVLIDCQAEQGAGVAH